MKRAGPKRTYNGERDEVAGDREGADLTLVASLVTTPQANQRRRGMKRAGAKRTYNGERDEVAGDGEGADLTLVASLVTTLQTSGGKG